jgi:hypothetical protein
MVESRKKMEGADQSEARPNPGNWRKDWETVIGRHPLNRAQSEAGPNPGNWRKNLETAIGRHPLNRALGGRCGEETGRVAERRGERGAVGLP